MAQVFPLNIQSKRLTWRMMESSHANVGNTEEYNNSRRRVLKRDDYTCRAKDCGFRSPPDATGLTYMEVHHLNDDHKNHSPENLATICPICHQVFHMGVAGMRNSAVMIWMPEISQGTINQLCRSIFVAIQTDSAMSGSAKAMYASLEARAIYLEEMMAPGSSDPLFFGQALLDINPDEISKSLLKNVRMLPTYERFKDAIEHWVANGYQGLLPDTWDALVKTSADPTLSSLRTYMPQTDDELEDTIFDGSIASRNHGAGLASAFAAMEKMEQEINDGVATQLPDAGFNELDALDAIGMTDNLDDELASYSASSAHSEPVSENALAITPQEPSEAIQVPSEAVGEGVSEGIEAELAGLDALDAQSAVAVDVDVNENDLDMPTALFDTDIPELSVEESLVETPQAEAATVIETLVIEPSATKAKSTKKKQSSFQSQGAMFNPDEVEMVAETQVAGDALVDDGAINAPAQVDLTYGDLSEHSFQDENLKEAEKQETFAGYLAVASGLPAKAPEKAATTAVEAADGGMMNLADQMALMDDLIDDAPVATEQESEVGETLATQIPETQSETETKSS